MKKIFVNGILVAFSVLIAFVLAEIALRLVGFSYPNLYVWDPYVGARLKPGAEGWWRQEGEAYVKINGDGLRDKEHSMRKPANTVRIVVLGDSYAEALQVPQEKAFWAITEQELNNCHAFGAKHVEVINFGVSGYGTAQELLTLEHWVWSFQPDIVLLAFLTGNDIRNNSKLLEPEKMRPFYVYRDGGLILDDSFIDSAEFKIKSSLYWRALQHLSQYCRTLQLLAKVKNNLVLHPAASADRQQVASSTKGAGIPALENGLDDDIYVEPKTREWQEAWTITEKLIVRMRDQVLDHGAKFMLVSLSNGMQVYPDAKVRQTFADKLGAKDLFYPDRRIESLAVKESIPHVILAPQFATYAQKNGTYLHGFQNTVMGFGHWNENGHRLAAEIISRELCTSGWDK